MLLLNEDLKFQFANIFLFQTHTILSKLEGFWVDSEQVLDVFDIIPITINIVEWWNKSEEEEFRRLKDIFYWPLKCNSTGLFLSAACWRDTKDELQF